MVLRSHTLPNTLNIVSGRTFVWSMADGKNLVYSESASEDSDLKGCFSTRMVSAEAMSRKSDDNHTKD